jgi:hypothetical protein
MLSIIFNHLSAETSELARVQPLALLPISIVD